MSKSFIPYHLRQNKAIDRNLFVDLLKLVGSEFHLKQYEYIGMGGPFLEDFKVIHAATGITRMISFEMESNTYVRQKFNRPLSCIRLKQQTSTEFIRDFDFPRPTVIWLDFTTPSRLTSDLNDVFELVAKLKRGDILKVTLNANVGTVPDGGATNPLEKAAKRLEHLENALGNYLPDGTTAENVTTSGYAPLLFSVLDLVVDRAMGSHSDLYFQKLSSFVYADGQQMLTFVGIILEQSETSEFLKATGIRKWPLNCVDVNQPISISVPDLSIKERLFLDSLLPNFSAETIQKRLKFRVAETNTLSLQGIENYARFYNQFPYFSKIVL